MLPSGRFGGRLIQHDPAGQRLTQHGLTQDGPTQHGPTQHGPTQHGPTSTGSLGSGPVGTSRIRRSGENSTQNPAAHEPATPTHSAGRTPISVPSTPPARLPSGSVPHTIQRTAAFIRPSSSGGQIACR